MDTTLPYPASMYPNFHVNSDSEISNHTDISHNSQIGAVSQPISGANNNVGSSGELDMTGFSFSNPNFERDAAPQWISYEMNAGPQYDQSTEMNIIPQPDAHINIETNYIPQLGQFGINTASHFDPNACVSAVFQPGLYPDIDMTVVPQLSHFGMNIIPPIEPQFGINSLFQFDPYTGLNTVTPANLHADFAMNYMPQLNLNEMNYAPSFGPYTGFNGIYQPDPQASVNMNYIPSSNHFETSTIAQSGITPEINTVAQLQPGLDMRAVSGSNLDVSSGTVSNISSNANASSETAKKQGAILRKIFKMVFQQFSNSSAKLAIIDANLVLSLEPKSKQFLLDSMSLTIGTTAHLVRDLQQPHRFLIGDKVLFNNSQKSAVRIPGCTDLMWIDVIPRSLIRPSLQAPKKKVEYRVPRPPNAYILYRKDKHRDVKAMNPRMDNNDVSRFLGLRWRHEAFEVRDHYQKAAADYKEMFMLTYPDYQYRPRKANHRKRRARRAAAV
nr:putative mating-type 1-2-1 protein [Ceratocystis albifundus]